MLQRTQGLSGFVICLRDTNHYLAITYVVYRRTLAAAWNADTRLTHGSRGNSQKGGNSRKRTSESSGHDLTVRR